MTVFKRVAASAAMALSLAGLLATSTPSLATNIAGAAATTPVSAMTVSGINAAELAMVPQSARATMSALPDFSQVSESDEDSEYASLAEAVADQDDIASSEELRCLAGAIYFESQGEPLTGQLAVAQVILNRTKSGRFPTGVCDVIKQRGQFSFVRRGEIPSISPSRSAYRTAVAVAKVALAQAWDGPAGKALFFNTPGNRPGVRVQKVAAIGNHIFYR
ncbi:cell wall hydrolase [Sphingomonas pseudosanguinis]|uniref:Spore germination cell wall hydrolase CwlJ-like protein n=1 Tax=Sphingomonas pseudosanguinis TaxID=413712 RepID=A0A7W6ACG1_9SPHN|nr:cell wall hydrolase [Sphingomonas pseudosanguinis]MBB3879428.1 spore germination cell wall hydrolase CwlJ-like protein [Sphingomonas pseudosanguinis]MBN3537085.1 cell wall hydrolase [Sphingomonas pseudosanguinis]